MDDNYTVSKERIREAAKRCPDAKMTLMILFPEAFENEVELRCGDIWKYKHSGEVYILSSVQPDGNSWLLTNLKTGSRRTAPQNRYEIKVALEENYNFIGYTGDIVTVKGVS